MDPSTAGSLADFCGFNLEAATYRERYLYNVTSKTLTPCAELLFIGLEHLPLIYFTITTSFIIQSYRRIDSPSVWFLMVSRVFASLSTALLCLLIVFLSSISTYVLPPPFIIECCFVAFAWLLHSYLWIRTLRFFSWTRRTGVIVSMVFGLAAFGVMCAQRWILFGFADVRTFLPLSVFTIHVVQTLLCFVEWRLSKRYWMQQLLDDDGYGSTPEDEVSLMPGGDENAGFFSRIFFCWTNDLIRKGYKMQLNEITDLFSLPSCLNTERIEKEFVESASTPFVDAEDFSLSKSLLRAFGGPFLALGVLKLASDAFTFAGPVLLHIFIVCLEDETCTEDGYIYSVLMMFASFLAAISSSNFNYYVSKIGLKCRSAVTTAIYDKLLRVRLSTLSSFSSGQILNFMSSDVDRIVNFCNSFHAFWSLPLQLAVALYLLHREIGLAFVSGLVAAILLVPLNKWITTKIGKLSAKMMHCKDERVKLISESVLAMRTVKLSNWERDLCERITVLRERELRYLRARKYLDAICVYLWASAPVLITIAIFSTYTLVLHERLTAAKVFTSLALVNILIMPLNAFPWVLSGIVEACVSLRRLDGFFALESIEMAALYSLTTDARQPLQLDDATFYWQSGMSVNNVTLNCDQGTVIGVVGPVGCGKSTLLLGILGETEVAAKHVRIRQSAVETGFAYVSQCCWLKRGTVRENVVCGAEFDARFYDEVIRVTALRPDIQAMPGSDEYEIGDGGSTLSGGQRARLALARALYQNREVYLLDDPFASVDAKVGKWIWEEAVLRMLRARGKLVIVTTHHVRFLKDADLIIVLDEMGNVIRQGQPSVILANDIDTSSSLNTDSIEHQFVDVDRTEQVTLQSEDKRRGKVRLSVYGSYLKATGIFLSLCVFAALGVMQGSKNVSDWWLSRWAELHPLNDSANGDSVPLDYRYPFGNRVVEKVSKNDWDETTFFLMIYAALAAGNTLFTLVRAFLFAFGGIRAARKLHRKLLESVLGASLGWWESTPSGRVINRLCADVYTVDDSLPFQFNIFLASSFNLVGSIVLTFIALPFLSPLVFVLFIIYYCIQRYYRCTTCEVKRLTSVSLSPLYSHLTDTISGLSTIRAFRFSEAFACTLRSRLSDNIRAQFSALASGQWLSIRLQILGVFMVSAVTITAILQRDFHYVSPGMVGLAITYALSTTNLLNSLLSSFIETEKELVSVERIVEYIEGAPPENNPSPILMHGNVEGRIDFACVSLRYGKGLPLALENVSFRVQGGSKVAILGRTGSGKSSLVQALLRASEIDSGKIYLDGVDICSVELHSLRSAFGVVTQTPFVFSGSLRENLLLGRNVTDEELLRVLKAAQLGNVVSRLGGLDGKVEEGGANVSFGEKQIISICRLVLAAPKVVIFDEATAHMDLETHSRMNALVQQFLPSATVISILHRTEGIDAYDSVILMRSGRFVWQGPPSELNRSRQSSSS